MKRILLLSGYACNPWIWKDIKEIMKYRYIVDSIEWPKDRIKDFHSLGDYADWLNDEVILLDNLYDYIIGHSMGGLVGIHFADKYPDKIKNIILVESFIKTPSQFFQNLIYEENGQELQSNISKMLKEESKLYSEYLPNQLKELDITRIIESLQCNMYAIYGNRGTINTKQVISELHWNKMLLDCTKIYSIKNSCHFPMLENPEEFNKILDGILL